MPLADGLKGTLLSHTPQGRHMFEFADGLTAVRPAFASGLAPAAEAAPGEFPYRSRPTGSGEQTRSR